MKKILRKLRMLFNLRSDTDQEGSIASIKANVDFKSANAWTLVFAIFIASVGLNTNSTAAIIGAMLISPLMGPIIGIGLALGTFDFELLKRAARNLSIAVFISVITATIYFWLSPIEAAQSELLARTHPSFFDVLIALFGGAAGIIAISRKEKGNVIPGVAIATALMPPLCTAGFGIASGHLDYFFGALYLFVINSVYIAVATFLVVRYLKFPRVENPNPDRQAKVHRWIIGIITATLVPSLVLVWFFQRESDFKSQAARFISQEMNLEKSFIISRKIDYNFKSPKLRLILIGETINDEKLEALKERLKLYDLKPEMLEIKQASLTERLSKQFNESISMEKHVVDQLHTQLNDKEIALKNQINLIKTSQAVTAEVMIFQSKIDSIQILESTSDAATENKLDKKINLVNVQWKTQPSKSEKKRINDYLEKRLDIDGHAVSHTKNIR